MTALRTDWRPTNRAEICAAISVASLRGEITPDDEAHIAGWIAFRRERAFPPAVSVAIPTSEPETNSAPLDRLKRIREELPMLAIDIHPGGPSPRMASVVAGIQRAYDELGEAIEGVELE